MRTRRGVHNVLHRCDVEYLKVMSRSERREEILGRAAFAVAKTVVIVRTVVIPSDTRAGDASRWVVLVVTWSRGHVIVRSRDRWRRVTVKPERDPRHDDDQAGRNVDMNDCECE